jgi:hypothetical protein
MRQKFPKFEREQNAAEMFQIGINERAKLQNSMNVDKTIVSHQLLPSNFIDFHKILCNTINFCLTL